MKDMFKHSPDKKSIWATIPIKEKHITIRIYLTDDYNCYENINWNLIQQLVQLLKNEFDYLIQKAELFSTILVKNSQLYETDRDRINGFELISIEITNSFGENINIYNVEYSFLMDIVSNYTIDTYGLLYVKFLHNIPVGVERVQN
jgi:hypothetical protein